MNLVQAYQRIEELETRVKALEEKQAVSDSANTLDVDDNPDPSKDVQ